MTDVAPDALAGPAEQVLTQRRWVGARLPRVEDGPLLTGRSRFVADLAVDGVVEATFVRSPHAHARVLSIDTSAATATPGVVAVLTGDDLHAAPITDKLPFPDAVKTPRHPLAHERVRFVGEPVALVIAADRYTAEDAAELVVVDYEPLEAVTDVEAAIDAPNEPLFDDAPDNVYYRTSVSTDGVDEAFAAAAYVHRSKVHTNRYLAVPMEGRGLVADHDAASGELTVWMSTQAPHGSRSSLARALGFPEHRIRVIAPAVGGAFGMKNPLYPEDLAVVEAAVRLGRPVRWIEDRHEHLLAAAHGKEQVISLELAFGEDAKLLAARGRFLGDAGAYSFSQVGGLIECMIAATATPGPYDLPEYAYEVIGGLTNKSPVAAYRGVGFTAAQTVREIALDEAARAMGVDRLELRRRNLIPADRYPYSSVGGMIYDSGSNHASFDLALEMIGADGFEEERAAARAEGRLLGLGVSPFVEMTSYGPRGGMQAGVPMRSHDNATITMDPDGHVRVAVGTFAHGQGHATTFSQLAADVLGVDPSAVQVLEGDTATSPYGMGTFGSRSAVFGGGAVTRAAAKLRDKLLDVASHLLEANVEDLELVDAHARVRGAPDRAVPLAGLAAAAYFDGEVRTRLGDALLQETAHYDAPTTYPNGCFAVVAEVDADTGQTRLLRAVGVDDCGTVINPTIVEGQLRGGFAQGVGGALLEGFVYDPGGQPLTTTYLDYLVPRATDVPRLAIGHIETPSPFTEGGVKGMAEGGAIAAPAAVIDAVMDALAPLGVSFPGLPLTPGRVWEAIQAANEAAGTDHSGAPS